MSELARAADLALAGLPTHRQRVERALAVVADLEGWAVMWSGGKDSTVCVGLAAEAWSDGVVIMSDNGADPIGRRELLHAWVQRAPHLLIVVRPSHPDDREDRRAAVRLAESLGVQGLILGLRASESGYRRRIARTVARGGSYRTAQHWGGLPAVCPILNWSLDDVWAYIHSRELPYWRSYDKHGRASRSPRNVVRGQKEI